MNQVKGAGIAAFQNLPVEVNFFIKKYTSAGTFFVYCIYGYYRVLGESKISYQSS